MASRNGKLETLTSSNLLVTETFSFNEMPAEVAHSILVGLEFGGKVLIASGANRDRAWRVSVKFRITPKVLTVQVVYSTNANWGDLIKNPCLVDAESILLMIDQILEANDVSGNDRVIQNPDGTLVKPEKKEDPRQQQQQGQGGQGGNQGGGGQGRPPGRPPGGGGQGGN